MPKAAQKDMKLSKTSEVMSEQVGVATGLNTAAAVKGKEVLEEDQ